MTHVIRKVPAVLLAVIVAAALTFAVGMTTQTAYAADQEWGTILFDGDANWGHTYAVDSRDAVKTLEDLKITVKDNSGALVSTDQYDIKIYLTWYDESKDEDVFIEVTDNKFSLRAEATEGYAEGFTQYEARATAKNGSTITNQFFITDKYSLFYVCPKIEFKDCTERGDWRMHEYFVVPVDKVQDVVVKGSDYNLLTKDKDYKATYYVRGANDTDDWGKIWAEDNPVNGLPTAAGNYFVKIEGISPYYGSVVVNLDVTDGSGGDTTAVIKAKATKKKPVVVKYSKVKKAKQSVAASKLIKSSVPVMFYEKTGGSKNLSVNGGTGKVTVKKGTKKGTYKIKLRVHPSGTNEYLLGTPEVTCYIKVK